MESKGRKRKATWKVVENVEEESKPTGRRAIRRRSSDPLSRKIIQSDAKETPAKGKSKKPASVSKTTPTRGKAVTPARGKAKKPTTDNNFAAPKKTGGKGKGSRGKQKDQKTSDEDILTELRRERKNKIQQQVSKLNDEKAKELLCLAAERDPSILHLIETDGNGDSSDPPEPHAPRPDDVPGWCICTHCREMPTDVEKKCCRRNAQNCLSESLDVANLVLDPMVLYIFRMYRADLFAVGNLDEGDLNRQNRHAAYRCYILWQYGRLRSGDRRVIPSCVLWKIRERYPDPHNQYRGFIRGRLG